MRIVPFTPSQANLDVLVGRLAEDNLTYPDQRWEPPTGRTLFHLVTSTTDGQYDSVTITGLSNWARRLWLHGKPIARWERDSHPTRRSFGPAKS